MRLCTALLSLWATVNSENLNGKEYLLSSNSGDVLTNYNTDFASKGYEYFDVYTPDITSQYSQTFWTMLPDVDLPADIVSRFANSTMAIVGYEADQVVVGKDGEPDVSVPITHAYNHHYGAFINGEDSKKILKKCDSRDHMFNMRGDGWCPTFTRFGDDESRSFGKEENGVYHQPIPDSQWFSEGNGGEFRKSWHGYPAGTAQLVKKPRTFACVPMQIDTWNRDYDDDLFHVGPLPARHSGPQNIEDLQTSPLTECPCTTRLFKQVNRTYTTILSDSCNAEKMDGIDGAYLYDADECFTAVRNLGVGEVGSTNIEDDESKPRGCYYRISSEEEDSRMVEVTFNSAESGASCGDKNVESASGSIASELTGVSLDVELDVVNDQATITMTGPADRWFAVAFSAHSMGDEPYAIIVHKEDDDDDYVVMENKLANHAPGTTLDGVVKVTSMDVTENVRTVVMTRPMKSLPNDDYYAFHVEGETSVPLLTAIGESGVFAHHKQHSQMTISFGAKDVHVCICSAGTLGAICGHADEDGTPNPDTCNDFPTGGVGGEDAEPVNGVGNSLCPDQPTSDLMATDNPTCSVETYLGGLRCCTHRNFLIDADQEDKWPDQTLTYSLKFRYWFEEYVEATEEAPASHFDLPRLYWQTER